MTTQPAIDEAKLNEFVGKFVGDLGAIAHAATVLIGDKLGLYKAMADGEPITADDLAERTGTDERYMREWLSAQAASGYVEYDPDTGRFRLPPEQAFALTNEYNPLFVPGGMQVAASTIKDADVLAEAIRASNERGLARAPPRPLRGHRALLPAQLHRQPGGFLDPGTRRHGG